MAADGAAPGRAGPAGSTEDAKQGATLGLFDATTIVAGSMIGSGIFLVSADIARLTGSPGWLLAVWLVAGALTMAAALSYGELAAMFPKAGGQYVYLREAFGPGAAFLFGWTQLLVVQTGTIAAVAVAFARFLGVIVPAINDHPMIGSGKVGPTPQRLVAIVLLVLLTWMNERGLRTGKLVQNGFTVAKGLVLLALVVLAVVVTPAQPGAIAQTPFFGPMPLATLGPAMVGALFASDAWNNVTFTAGEVRNPQRNVPGSLLWGTGLVTLFYLSVNLGYLKALPLDAIAHAPSDRVASAMVGTMLGPGAAILVTLGILVSTFGCANGMVLAGARVSYAMAQDGLFLRPAGRLNKAGVPGVALWMQAGWAALLCLSGTYSELLDYVVFAVLLFYILTLLGLSPSAGRDPTPSVPTAPSATRSSPRCTSRPRPSSRSASSSPTRRARRPSRGSRACSRGRRCTLDFAPLSSGGRAVGGAGQYGGPGGPMNVALRRVSRLGR